MRNRLRAGSPWRAPGSRTGTAPSQACTPGSGWGRTAGRAPPHWAYPRAPHIGHRPRRHGRVPGGVLTAVPRQPPVPHLANLGEIGPPRRRHRDHAQHAHRPMVVQLPALQHLCHRITPPPADRVPSAEEHPPDRSGLRDWPWAVHRQPPIDCAVTITSRAIVLHSTPPPNRTRNTLRCCCRQLASSPPRSGPCARPWKRSGDYAPRGPFAHRSFEHRGTASRPLRLVAVLDRGWPGRHPVDEL